MRGTPRTPRTGFEASHLDAGKGSNLGTVLPVDPLRHVATISDGKEGVHEEAAIAAGVGPDGGGWFGTPMPGWNALVSRESGTSAIAGMMPTPSLFNEGPDLDHYTGEINTFLALTGTPKIYRKIEGTQRNFRSHRPTDLIAGDQGFRTPEGAVVAALRGGVALVKASDLAQVIVNQVDDLLRLIGRNTELFTDWGNVQFVNEDGKVKLIVRGNADGTLTHEDTFAYELSVGTGDSFWDMKLYKEGEEGKAGSEAHKLALDRKGHSHKFQIADEEVWVGGNAVKTIIKDELRVVKGSQEIETDVEHTLKCPSIHFGDRGGEMAPMGRQLYKYMWDLWKYMATEMRMLTPSGPTIMPGTMAAGSLPPQPPDFLSRVVDYTQYPGG